MAHSVPYPSYKFLPSISNKASATECLVVMEPEGEKLVNIRAIKLALSHTNNFLDFLPWKNCEAFSCHARNPESDLLVSASAKLSRELNDLSLTFLFLSTARFTTFDIGNRVNSPIIGVHKIRLQGTGDERVVECRHVGISFTSRALF
ncbi:hypothetical protein CUMW_128000 [Citrus unshiu]|uniref:Uncharacterized protein n=1 Tax=Citrus unshiu TaxID=55188 RepID=A0A2H5PE33_CITUN|nr:hypothetical protein CUMW_128000 [Citrus unshiu]